MATHSSILAWEIPWTEEPGWLQLHGVAESDMTQPLNDNMRCGVGGGDVVREEGDVGRNMGVQKKTFREGCKVDGEETALLERRGCTWK